MELKSRIFVTTSPINVLFYLLYSKLNRDEQYNDVLIICNGHMNQASFDKLNILLSQHNWSQIIKTHEELQTSQNIKISFTKRITRKIRKFAIVKPFYDFSRKIFEKKEKEKQKNWLSTTLSIPNNSSVELNLLTETTINNALLELFPKSKVNYFEHGLSDYVMVESMPQPSTFYCLFNDEFESYLNEKQKNQHIIAPIYQNDHFYEIAASYLSNFKSEFQQVFPTLIDKSKYVLVLMQDFENLGVSPKIHIQFFEKIRLQLGDGVSSVVFLIKPHPKQSLMVMNDIEQYLKTEKLNYTFLKEPIFQYTSIELFFYLFKDSTSHVFSFYSSGLFYLSKLYHDSNIKYMYTFDYISNEISRMPPEVGAIHTSFMKNQLQLFTKNCTEF